MSSSDKQGFFSRFLQSLPVRKIRSDIVTLFFFSVGISSLIIILFTYYRDYKGLLNLSDTMIKQVHESLIEKISSLTHEAQAIAEITKGLFLENKDISVNNQQLIHYLMNALIVEPLAYSISIGTSEGNLISVINMKLSKEAHYYSKPSEPLPEKISLVVRSIDRTQTPQIEKWEYKGTNFQTIETETLTPTYDPRMDNWYETSSTWPHVHWSEVSYNVTGEPVIIVSVPVEDTSGKVFAVVGVKISLNYLSNFIAHQKVGLSGAAFILQNDGSILIPSIKSLVASKKEIYEILIAKAFDQFVKTRKYEFLIEEEGSKYFVYFSDFPLSFETKWLVATVIPFNDFFGPIIKTAHQTILISLLILVCVEILIFFISKYISIPIVNLAKDVDKIKHFDFEPKKPTSSRIEEIIALDSSVAALRTALRVFGRYVPKEIVRTLIEQGQEITLGMERRQVTVFFSDVENFTTLSEALTTEELSRALAQYFDVLSKIILKNEGTIDKYIGDSIMALWGAPQSVVNAADKACAAALECLYISEQKEKERLFPPWKTRFGIHTGDVLVGNIGTNERMNYTAIGNTVNTAARLQSINKEYHTSILISESVHEEIGTRFVTRPIDHVAVKGKRNLISIFELVGIKEGRAELMAPLEKIELSSAFTHAFFEFHSGKLREALALFMEIKEKFPSDYPTQIYINRINAMMAH